MQEESAERTTLHADYRSDLLRRQLSNSENFDRSVLSLSSALLAGSIAFVRPGGNSPGTEHLYLLAGSWVALGTAIAGTMVSFLVSQKAIEGQLELADRYYREGQGAALTEVNAMARMTERLNVFAGLAFLVGVVLTIWFAVLSTPTR